MQHARASRPLLAGAGGVIGIVVASLLFAVAPAAGTALTLQLAAIPFVAFALLALTLEQEALPGFIGAAMLSALFVVAARLAGDRPTLLELMFGFASIGLTLIALYAMAKAGASRLKGSLRQNALLYCAIVAALGLYCFHYVAESSDLMFGDFMHYRVTSVVVASVIQRGRIFELLGQFIVSMKDEYCLLAGLLPGAVLAATDPLSRAWYAAAEIVFYAAPAFLALAALAREIAAKAGARDPKNAAVLAIGVVAIFAAYPTGAAVVARGMPDIGGVALMVVAIRLCDRLVRLLALPPGHDIRVARLVRRVTLALALTLFGMFLFRRWYAFAGAGIGAITAAELGAQALRGRFRWREAVMAGAFGVLVLLALVAPIVIDWAQDPAKHDYGAIYAAYRKEPAVFAGDMLGWFGLLPLVAAIAGAIALFARSRESRLLRLTVGSGLVAGLLFLRVQSPAVHHVYLLMPAFAVPVAAAILAFFTMRERAAMLVCLLAVTLTPAISGWAPGLAPTGGMPHAPRSDLAELYRLKAFAEAEGRPDHRVCVLGSSYTINDVLVEQLWQVEPKRSPVIWSAADRTDVMMTHVDTRDGPPTDGIRDCAIMLVGDPVQTHLVRDYQQTIIVPASEMLAGEGIGTAYRRTGETFALEHGVKLVVFDRIRPLTEADMEGLRERWRLARDRANGGARMSADLRPSLSP